MRVTQHTIRTPRQRYNDTAYTTALSPKRAFIRKAKDKPCADCGRSFPTCAMDFDHRPGTVKLFTLATGACSYGMKKIIEEIAKCDVVCAVCHRIRTWITRRASGLEEE